MLGLNPSLVHKRAPGSRPTVLVAMGGSDPHGLTLRMAKALAVLDSAYRVRFVIGTGIKDANAVARGLVALKQNYETVEGADDLSVEYASADVAICAFGVTAYELAACGIPAIYLGLTQDHVLSASAFADAGMGTQSGPGGQNLRRRYRALPAMAVEQAGGAARNAQTGHGAAGWAGRVAHCRGSGNGADRSAGAAQRSAINLRITYPQTSSPAYAGDPICFLNGSSGPRAHTLSLCAARPGDDGSPKVIHHLAEDIRPIAHDVRSYGIRRPGRRAHGFGPSPSRPGHRAISRLARRRRLPARTRRWAR